MICNYLQIQSMHVSCQHYDWHASQLWWSWKILRCGHSLNCVVLKSLQILSSNFLKIWTRRWVVSSYYNARSMFESGFSMLCLSLHSGKSLLKCMTDSWFKIDEFFIPAIHFHCLESRSLKIMPVTRVFLHCCLLKNRKFNIHSCQFSTRRQIFHFELNRRLHIR